MNVDELKIAIEQGQKIVITTHKNPDGDAIGSSLGLALTLKKKNQNVTVIYPNDYPHFLSWIEGVDDCINFEKNKEQADHLIEDADLIFCLDYNAFHRTGEMENILAQSKGSKIMIDHHLDPEPFSALQRSDTSASSTAEMVYNFLEELNYTQLISPGAAEALYCGIMTDTGSFKFPCTTKRTHEVVGALIAAGANNSKIHQQVYDSSSVKRIQLLGHCLANMVVIDNKYALFVLSKEDQERFNVQKGDTEGIVNYGLAVETVIASAILKESEEGVKMSFRSKGDVDMNQFARKYFNGGGHKNAAGGYLEKELSEVVALYKSKIVSHA